MTDQIIELSNVYDDVDNAELNTTIRASNLGIVAAFEGFEECAGGTSEVVLIENRNGVPHIVIWADRDQQDPTHIISLKDARESKDDA